MKALKLEMSGGEGSPAAGSGKFILKTAKGTRDFQPDQMAVRCFLCGCFFFDIDVVRLILIT